MAVVPLGILCHVPHPELAAADRSHQVDTQLGFPTVLRVRPGVVDDEVDGSKSLDGALKGLREAGVGGDVHAGVEDVGGAVKGGELRLSLLAFL